MKKILFYSIIIASLLISQIIIAPNVYATGSWNSAAAHTAAVDKMEAAAADAAVAAAIAAVKSAEAAVAAAETAILTALANPTPANTAPLLAALAAAIVSLAKAKAILASAGTVVLGIGAFALGIFIGTSAYQAGWGIEDLCFDPVCPVTSSLTIIPDYQSVTETEIDLLIPEIIFETTGKKMIKEDFVSSEIGKVSWTYMSEGFGFFINTYRGAVAASEDKHTQVLNAVDDMNISLEAIPKIHLQVADILENTPVIPKDTLEELQTSSDELGVIIIELEELEFDNPELMELLKTSKLSIDESILEVSKLYDSHGDPRTLVGEEGLFPNLNRSDLQKFSQKCKDLGKECLPKSEIIIANMLLDATNVNDPKYDFPSELAKSDSRTFPNEENAIFSSSDSVTLAHILRASATTLSDSGKWLNVDLEESPLTIAARAALDSEKEDEDFPIIIIIPIILIIVVAAFIMLKRKKNQ